MKDKLLNRKKLAEKALAREDLDYVSRVAWKRELEIVNKKMLTRRVVNSITHWIGCDKETAKMIFNGVWDYNGDNYSAILADDETLEIYKNGFIIHKITMI